MNCALECLPQVIRQNGITVTTSMKNAHAHVCDSFDALAVWVRRYLVRDPKAVLPCDKALKQCNCFLEAVGKPIMDQRASGCTSINCYQTSREHDARSRAGRRPIPIATLAFA